MAPASLAFGTVTTGTLSTTQAITVTNNGNANLSVSGVTLTGTNPTEFTVVTNGCTVAVAPAGNCIITVRFNPATTGVKAAAVSIAHNAAGTPSTVPVGGTGGSIVVPAPVASVAPASLAFGTVTTGTLSTTQAITVTNSGTANLSVSGVTLTGTNPTEFTVVTNGCTVAVAPAGNCIITVRFNPATTGVKAAAVSIAHNAAGSPNAVPVGGTGAAPGGVAVTQTVSNTTAITIRDNASASLYPAPVTISGMTGAITKVVVTVRGLTHTFARDVDILLVAPGGQKSMVVSDAIGNRAISNLTMIFDATAVNSVPADTAVTAGSTNTYKPTDYLFGSSIDNFNITPPAGGTAGPAAPYTVNFGVFTGLSGASLNGVWRLFVLDDGAADTGSISGGWTLAVTAQ